MFTKAIVCPPARNFSEGITTSRFGVPKYELAVEQYKAYCAALERCGLTLTRLQPDPRYPDSTFVEDAAVLTERCAVLARPGAPSRLGEVTSMRGLLGDFYPVVHAIQAPGTLDGGDICEAEDHFFIGISDRTNEPGAQQFAEFLAPFGYTSSFVDIRNINHLLHLKSGIAYLGDNRLVVRETLIRAEFAGYELVRVGSTEDYAANCIRVNDYVLVAAGYPALEGTLQGLGYQTIALEMSEFQKMDGGLSCLSIRF